MACLYRSSQYHGHTTCFSDHFLFNMYYLWVTGWNTWKFILSVPFLYYSLGCYHEHNPYKLTFFDMTSATLLDIYAFGKKKEFIHLLTQLILLASIYLIWYERNNRVFHQIYQSHQDVCEDIFYLVRYCLVELEPRFHISATFKSIWRLKDSWDIIALADIEIMFNTSSYVINKLFGSCVVCL